MKKILLSTMCSLTIGGVFSQITITQADFAVIGDTVINAVDSFPTISIGNSGANVTWDFSSLKVQSYKNQIFLDPSTVTGAASFPTANLVLEEPTQTTFLNSNVNSVEIIGINGDPFGLGTASNFTFNPSLSLIKFPGTYLSTGQDTSRMLVIQDASSFGIPGVDSVKFTRDTQTDMVFDAYGNITTPAGTFASVRHFITDFTTDSIWLHSPLGWSLAPVGGGGLPANPILGTTYTYRWYANNEKAAIAEVTTNATKDTVLTAQFTVGALLVGTIQSTSNADCGTTCNGTASISGLSGKSPYTYKWDSNAGGGTNAIVNNLCPGNYSATITDLLNNTATVTVTIGENPTTWGTSFTVSDATCNTCSDGSATATPNGASPYTYTWDNSQTTATATGLAQGNYNITVSDANGCSSVASAFVGASGTTSSVESIAEQLNDIKIYPVPASEFINITAANTKITAVEIYNVLGEKVVNKNNTSTNLRLNLTSLNKGIYFVKIYSGKLTTIKKITLR